MRNYITKISFLLFGIFLFQCSLFAEVYVNGVKAVGLSNQKFTGCTVVFDKKGNIHIKAPGVTLVQQSSDSQLSKNYFFSLNLDSPTKKPVKIQINGSTAYTLKPGQTSIVENIKSKLKKGKNSITLIAAPENVTIGCHFIVGTGKESNDNIQLTPIRELKKNYAKKGLSATIKFKAE